MEKIRKMSDLATRITGFLIVAIFTVMIGACVLQVFTRYALNNSLSWTEELARYTFIWSNFLGAAICVRKGSHATVTVILDYLVPRRIKKHVLVLIQTIIAFSAFIMVYYGTQVAYLTRMQNSPAMKVNMSLINMAVPVCGGLILLHALVNIIDVVAGNSEGGSAI